MLGRHTKRWRFDTDENQCMKTTDKSKSESSPVRLPGFLNEKDIGLGDVIKRATSYVGITPCGGCEGRAAALNRRFVFSAASQDKRSSFHPK
jgi:hypothetical protein